MEKIVIVKWKLKESEVSRILKMLPELAEKTRNEEGNISYTIYQSESDPRELILHEHYVDDNAAETHKQSQHYKRIVVNEIIPHLEVREVILVKKLV
ncbi:MAG: putative quinol monooxygenase [Nostoc sp. DedQUE01]|nr:putative quinol monooxygenase [Nostoc sp. DedQUE01]